MHVANYKGIMQKLISLMCKFGWTMYVAHTLVMTSSLDRKVTRRSTKIYLYVKGFVYLQNLTFEDCIVCEDVFTQ